jgi:UDP-N-acetylglucosamine 1-carboxyvinyltransferase
MEATVQALRDAGITAEPRSGGLQISADGSLRSVNVSTAPFPGFATDMQAQLMAMLCRSEGTSVLTETVFENRYMHVPELTRMGAQIETSGRTAIVKGVSRLSGAEVMATDLRASMSLVIAGLAAEGETQIHRLYHLDRGYERLEEKLSQLGAEVERVDGG